MRMGWQSLHLEIGRQRMIDPGHVASSITPTLWASRFLRLEMPPSKSWSQTRTRWPSCAEKLAEKLDWSRLPEDSSEFLMRVTRHGRPA